MTTEEVDAVAQGRVWSGVDAYELGLVDNLGDLDDAIAAAAELAELGDDYEISYIEKELELKDKILRDLMAEAVAVAGFEAAPATPLDEMLRRVKDAAADLAALNDPNHAYALSNIETD
jgi:protease-4